MRRSSLLAAAAVAATIALIYYWHRKKRRDDLESSTEPHSPEPTQPDSPEPATEPHSPEPARTRDDTRASPGLSPAERAALKAELRKIPVSKESYVAKDGQLHDVDEQGFMAAGALLWCRQVEGVDGVAVLLAEEKRKADGPMQLNFVGGKRDALSESARETAAREVREETGELISAASLSAILHARDAVLWDARGKYVVFLVEVGAAEDATVPRRLAERGGTPDPYDTTLKGLQWVAVSDILNGNDWIKANVAEHHRGPLKMLRGHLRRLDART